MIGNEWVRRPTELPTDSQFYDEAEQHAMELFRIEQVLTDSFF